jgi:multisubunit Na+/H+ antiporter MnhB subunit
MTSELTRMVARALLVPVLVVCAAILVKGYTDVGDGFAAGVVASCGLLLQYVAFGRERVESALPVRLAPVVAVAGLMVVVVVLAAPLFFGQSLLEHWPPADEQPVHLGSLELITAVVFDIGVALLVVGAVTTIITSVIAADPEPDT